MQNKLSVIVESKYPFSLKNKIMLKTYGLQMNENGVYEGCLNKRDYKKLNAICLRKKLKLRLNNNFTIRSTDYRKKFFLENPPIFFNHYFCAYCGRIVGTKKITVDHLYPVNSTKKSLALQEKLKNKGYSNINDIKNLVPACKTCNSLKSDKLGIWIIRGKIGRIQSLWVPRHLIRITCLIIFISYIYTFAVNNHIL